MSEINDRYYEALREYDLNGMSVFLAGGITGCPDWQQEMAVLLRAAPVVLLNPRRADFPIHDPNAAEKQIAWEWRHLLRADAVLFWFAKETIQPIVLFELGHWSAIHSKPLFVGAHPEYPRRQDVVIQLGLERPGLEILESLQQLAHNVSLWASAVEGL